MNWWRAHHGISNDIKISIVASKIGATKAEVGWCWIIALDYASQHEEDRGSIAGLEMEEVAAMAGIDVALVSNIFTAFVSRKMISKGGRLTAWEKRQPKRERPDDDSTQRVQQLRNRKRHVTPCNAIINQETPRVEQSRTEQSREEQKPLCAADAAQAGELALLDLGAPLQNRTEPKDAWMIQEHDRWYRDAYWCHQDRAGSRRAFKKRMHVLMRDLSAEQAAAFLHEKARADRERFENTRDWEWRQNLYPATWLNGERWNDEAKKQELVTRGRSSFVADVERAMGKNLAETGKPW